MKGMTRIFGELEMTAAGMRAKDIFMLNIPGVQLERPGLL